MKKETILAFDIGGTKVASALVDLRGEGYEIRDYKKTDTPRKRGEILSLISEEIRNRQKSSPFSRISFAVAGQIDAQGEKIIAAPNIPELCNFALGKAVAKESGLPVVLLNDVRAFALGEDRFGRHQGHSNAVFLAIGTGIGGAIKLEGKFYSGRDNIAGEFGHMTIVKEGKECACGRHGCWERYFSGPALEELYAERYRQKKAARDIVRGALSGNVDDRRLVLEASAYFLAGLGNVINVLDPEIVILGGSMFKEKGFLKFITLSLKSEVLPSARKIKVVNSSLGDKAFLLGAAVAGR